MDRLHEREKKRMADSRAQMQELRQLRLLKEQREDLEEAKRSDGESFLNLRRQR